MNTKTLIKAGFVCVLVFIVLSFTPLFNLPVTILTRGGLSVEDLNGLFGEYGLTVDVKHVLLAPWIYFPVPEKVSTNNLKDITFIDHKIHGNEFVIDWVDIRGTKLVIKANGRFSEAKAVEVFKIIGLDLSKMTIKYDSEDFYLMIPMWKIPLVVWQMQKDSRIESVVVSGPPYIVIIIEGLVDRLLLSPDFENRNLNPI